MDRAQPSGEGLVAAFLTAFLQTDIRPRSPSNYDPAVSCQVLGRAVKRQRQATGPERSTSAISS
jgi:hypothetical protein